MNCSIFLREIFAAHYFNKEISAHLCFRYKGSLMNRNVLIVAIKCHVCQQILKVTIIECFRYIKIQLGSEACRTQRKEIKRHMYSFLLFLSSRLHYQAAKKENGVHSIKITENRILFEFSPPKIHYSFILAYFRLK